MYGVSEFLFSVAYRDLEVEVFPSFLDTVNHDSSISFWDRHAMDCPALNGNFSIPVSNYFQFFPELI